jgi:hypothetical protein
MQRSKLFTAIFFSIALIVSGFASAQAQGKKKGNKQGNNSPTPIGIQVAEPVDREAAKVRLLAANVRSAGGNVFAVVQWDFSAPQGSRVEAVDVEVIGEFGNNTGVSEKQSFGAVKEGSLFLSKIAEHPASDFTNINAKIAVKFRDLSNNQLFVKGTVKNFPVTVKQVPPAQIDPVRVTVKPTQVNGLSTFVFWEVSGQSLNRKVESFDVTITADLDRQEGVRSQSQGRTLQNPADRSTQFNFAQIGVVNAFAILKTRVVVVAFVRDLNSNSVDRITAIRDDVFPPAPLPVVNLAVSDFKASLNNLVSASWTINGEAGSVIRGFEIKMVSIFPDNQQKTQIFQASAFDRSLTKSLLPSNGAPNGFKQVAVTVTAKMQDQATGRKFDVSVSRKLF